jgi:hypothetical protein
MTRLIGSFAKATEVCDGADDSRQCPLAVDGRVLGVPRLGFSSMRETRFFWLSIYSFLLVAGPFSSYAQEAINVTDFYFKEDKTQGVLSGCELVYKGRWNRRLLSPRRVCYNRWRYWYFQPEGKAFTLTSKVCGYDFVKETRTSVQFPIAYAFPIFGNTSMAKTEDKHTVSRNAPTNSISMIIPSIC